MTTIADPISIFVKNQLPDFYKNEGPRFIAFLEAYYEWLESEGQALGFSRDLLELRDVDQTLDTFLDHFREKYLVNVKFNPRTSNRDLIKHAVEIYRSKGTSRAIQLLFLLLFNENAKVFYPGDNVLRPSDGTWVIPRYLELSKSDVGLSFTNKSILGTRSGATALVERVDRRNVNGKVIDVAYVTRVIGLFRTGERIVPLDTGVTKGAPLMVGSVTTVDILQQGRDFEIGDIVNLMSDNLGLGARARVSNTGSATGRVTFDLVDGGSGYTTSANVLISERVLFIQANTTTYANSEITSYRFREVVSQSLSNIEYTSSNTTFVVNQSINGNYANGSIKATGKILDLGNNYVIVQNTSGDFTSTATITINATAGAVVVALVDRSANAVLIGSNATAVGVVNITQPYLANGSFKSLTTGITANIASISTGSAADFNIGLLSDTEQVFLNTDLLSGNNTSNVAYLSLALSAAGYGFPKLPSGNLNNILSEVLTINTFTIGTIATLTGINPGSGYNANPFVKVIDDNIDPFQRKNLRLLVSNVVGTFVVGEDLNQQYTQSTYLIKLTSPVGTYQALETVRQTQANTNVVLGQVLTYTPANTTLEVVSDETFDTSANVVGLTSGATGAVDTISAGSDDIFTKGRVLSSNSTSITLKRTRFATSFASGIGVTGSISGATANVTDVFQLTSSLAMGNNAVIDADAGTANGIITSLEVVDSGFAYTEGESVTISNPDNVFVGTGIIRLKNQGKGEGYWSTSRGFLNNKYIHDSDYYQDFSYEIQTGASLTRYASIVKQVSHLAGTRLFGRVVEDATGLLEATATISITLS